MDNTLQLSDITKSFGQAPVLTGVSLTITPGETVAIMGPSGSGKSTLLHCMSGVLVPDHGQISLGGRPLNTLSDAKRSRIRLQRFGFVFQDGQLLPELTALENISLPQLLIGTTRAQAKLRSRELIARMGINQLADRRPGQMSGGQAQRVAIARAMAINPGIIFADEPTGALDQGTGHEVMQQLLSVVKAAGSTLVMVTHDPKVADWCDRRVEIRDGIIHDDRRLHASVHGATPPPSGPAQTRTSHSQGQHLPSAPSAQPAEATFEQVR